MVFSGASTKVPAASGCRIGSVSHLLLPFLAICSSDQAGRMHGVRTQSKLPIEIVAGIRQPSSHICTQPQTHAFRSGSESDTNVGAGCSCHPTGSHHLRSTRVPLHPVWPRASCTLFGTEVCPMQGMQFTHEPQYIKLERCSTAFESTHAGEITGTRSSKNDYQVE